MSNFKIVLEENIGKILNNLQIGIKIPILPEFNKYIYETFMNYNVKALLMQENKQVVGITILFSDNEILFFGFFGILNHSKDKIQFLTNTLIEFAREKEYKLIRGPVNIPIIIFGFGFMEEGSNKQIWIGKPINPPLYQKILLKNGFYVKYVEDTYLAKLNRFDLEKLQLNFDEFEYINVNRETLKKYLPRMIELHMNNMPDYSQITPNTPENVKTLFDYIFDHGKSYMVWVVKYKPTNKIVATGHMAPNPFMKDKNGNLNSVSFEHLVVDKEYQGKGIAVFIYSKTMELAIDPKGNGLKFATGSYGKDNKKIISYIKNYMDGKLERRHVILEYNFLKSEVIEKFKLEPFQSEI